MENFAIILGVDKYTHAPDLPCCSNDAQVIADLLEATAKYKILRLNNDISKQKAQEEISSFLSIEGTSVGEVLFYFSGHGMQDVDMHYALKDTDPNMISSTALNNTEVDSIVRKVSPKLFVKIIDSCHSGLSYIKGINEAVTDDLNLSSKEFDNCIFMCSSKQSQSSLAGNPYSKFTKALVDAVDSVSAKTVKFTDLQNYLSDIFAKEHPEQTPYFSTQCDGTEVFCEKTGEVIDFFKKLKGQNIAVLTDEDSVNIEKVSAYLERCRSEQQVKIIMEEIQNSMEEQQIDNGLLQEFYELVCNKSVPFINYSFREDHSIVKTLYKRPYSENLFVEFEFANIKNDSPLGVWSPSYKKEPISFISKAHQVPEVISYHLKSKNENLPDYIIPFIFIYSPTFIYVFTCTKQFLKKGWNSYEEVQGTKYTYSKIEFATYSQETWITFLKDRLSQGMNYAKKTLMEHAS